MSSYPPETAAPAPVPGAYDSAAAESSESGEDADGAQSATPSPAAVQAARFEREVRDLRGCLATLPPLQWRLAVMRAGIYGGEPLTRGAAASKLDVSRARVRRIERSVLSTLQANAHSGGCDAGDAASPTLGAGTPPLALSSSLGEATLTPATTRPRSDSAKSGATDQGDERAAGGVGGFFEQAAAGSLGGSMVARPAADDATHTALMIALLTLASGAGFLYLRRRALFTPATVRLDALRSTMAFPGDVLPFVDGSESRVPAATANDEELEMEVLLPPSTKPPPKHVHPGQQEDYEVLEGTLDVFIRDDWHTLEAGETVSVRRGEVHTFRVGDEPVRLRTVHFPGLDFEDYFATESALSRAGKIRSRWSPRAVLHYAVLLREYRHCMVIADRPLRLLLRVLAPVSRRLGFGRP